MPKTEILPKNNIVSKEYKEKPQNYVKTEIGLRREEEENVPDRNNGNTIPDKSQGGKKKKNHNRRCFTRAKTERKVHCTQHI